MGFSEEIFASKVDIFKTVNINKHELPTDTENFRWKLTNSLKKWKKDEVNGIWLTIGIEKSELIAEAVKLGFEFHHCEGNSLLMTKWLSDKPKKLLKYTSHFIGIGGVVINEKNEILVVQERYKFHDYNPWKIPGGLVDAQEFLGDAAIREVFEETGVKSEFVSIISFRELNNLKYGNNEIFFVTLLKPLTHEIKFDPLEIAACQWMPIDEFYNQPQLIETQKRIARMGIFKKENVQFFKDRTENLLELTTLTSHKSYIEIENEKKDKLFHSCKALSRFIQEHSAESRLE